MVGHAMMARLLTHLAGWRGYAVVGLAVAILAGAAAWTAHGWLRRAEVASLKASYATVMEEHARAALDAVQAAREQERRRAAELENARDEAKKMAAANAAAAGRAAAERDRLHARAAALVADAARRDPALAAGSPPGAAPIDLLADVLGRAIDRSVQLAAVADSSRTAGLTCERAYDSIRSQ